MTSFYINHVRKSLSKKYIEGVFNSIIGERIVKSVKLVFSNAGFNKCIVYFLDIYSDILKQLVNRIKQEGSITVIYKNKWSNKTHSYNEKYWRVYIHKERFQPRVMTLLETENMFNKNDTSEDLDLPVEPLYSEEEWIYNNV